MYKELSKLLKKRVFHLICLSMHTVDSNLKGMHAYTSSVAARNFEHTGISSQPCV